MRQKNIKRAAEALYESQADDKNKVLASFIENKDVRKRVQDQGRALLILERLVLPQGKFSFSFEEIHSALLTKLEKKGHRIQEDDAEDDEQYAQEKEQFTKERLEMVGDVLGKTVAQVEEEKRCDSISPVHGFTCVLDKGHEAEHESKNHVKWGYGGFAENQEKFPEPEVELTEEEKQELKEAQEIQERLLDDLPEVTEVEDQVEPWVISEGPTHKDEFGLVVDCGTDLDDAPEIDLPEVAWQLIGQAYIDGIRTGRSST